MFKRVCLLIVMVVLVAFAGSVGAQEDPGYPFDTTHVGDLQVGFFTDGRVNAYQVAAPVAIYYSYSPPRLTSDGSTVRDVNGIELWTISDGIGQKAVSLPLTDIKATVTAAKEADALLASSAGFTLNHSPSGYYWVSGPSGYNFTWSDAAAR